MSRLAQRMRLSKTLDGLPPTSEPANRVRYVWNRIVAEATVVITSQEDAEGEYFEQDNNKRDDKEEEEHDNKNNNNKNPRKKRNVGRRLPNRGSMTVSRIMNYFILSSNSLLQSIAKRTSALVAPSIPTSSFSSSSTTTSSAFPSTSTTPSSSSPTLATAAASFDLDHRELIDNFLFFNDWEIDMKEEEEAEKKRLLEAESKKQQRNFHNSHSSSNNNKSQQQQKKKEEELEKLEQEFSQVFATQRQRFSKSLEFTLEQFVAEDLIAAYDRDPAALRLLEPLLYGKGFHALQLHRLAERIWYAGDADYSLLLQSASARFFGVDIHPAAHFGRGVMIDHGSGVVVGETAVVGNNVSMLHSVTLGGTGKAMTDRHPKIRDGVLIGAGALILGNIEVGEKSRVAAGAVVVKNVGPNQTVVGVAAKELQQNPSSSSPAPVSSSSFSSSSPPQVSSSAVSPSKNPAEPLQIQTHQVGEGEIMMQHHPPETMLLTPVLAVGSPQTAGTCCSFATSYQGEKHERDEGEKEERCNGGGNHDDEAAERQVPEKRNETTTFQEDARQEEKSEKNEMTTKTKEEKEEEATSEMSGAREISHAYPDDFDTFVFTI